MSTEMWATARKIAETYEHRHEQEAYLEGFARGQSFADYNVPELGDEHGDLLVDKDNIREIHRELCFEAEMRDREFSPFESTAHYFNTLEEPDEAWGAFEQGITDAIELDLSTYTYEDEDEMKVPTWTVFYGPSNSCRVFRTEHHAEQFYRALLLNGTQCQLIATEELKQS